MSNRVYQGDFKADTNDVAWTELEPLRKTRGLHITFKMKDNVYVAGGFDNEFEGLSTCEQFNLLECKWVNCKHSLPYALNSASVVVSADETFAVITGGITGEQFSSRVIIFTEDTGFELMATHLLNKRAGHLSMLL